MIFADRYARISARWALRSTKLNATSLKNAARREAALFLGLLFLGFVIMPLAIFWVGQRVLGEFGGVGYAEFFGNLSGNIRSGDPIAWFFVLSPYLGWQILRLMRFAWRRTT